VALALPCSACDPEAVGSQVAAAVKTPPVPLLADPQRSKLGFQILRTTSPHDVHFERFGGVMVLRGTEPIGLVVSVRTDSLVTEAEELTDHLKTAEFLDTERFPTAKFVSTSITVSPDAEASHEVQGALTLHGVSNGVRFPGDIVIEDGVVITRGELSVRPSDYSIRSEEMEADMVLDEVVLAIELHFPLPGAPG
jgi:polyisoprenoid-binding protein YceI